MPLAYALKGRSLSNCELRYLINNVRKRVHEREIKVLCEIYDGQWQYTVMHDAHGNPLNMLRVCTSTWLRISKLSKARIVDELMTINCVKLGDIDLLRFSTFTEGTNIFNNIEVTKTSEGALHISTLGGTLLKRPCAKYIVSPCDEHLWKEESSRHATCATNVKKVVPKLYGLRPAERNILSALPSDIVNPFLELEENNGEGTDEDEEYLPDLMPIQSGLWQLFSSENFKLLEDIAVELKEHAPDKWNHLTVSGLFPDMLCDSKLLVAKCTKDEIRVIRTVLESYTSRPFFNASFIKARNANIITRAFEGTNFVQELSKPRPVLMKTTPGMLKEQCLKLLLDRSYPLLPLQVSYANVTNSVKMMDWAMKSKIQMSVKIPRKIAGLPDIQFQLFSYPAFSAQRNQLEPRTLDFSHVLTNIRMHICRHGYDFCKMEHFLELCSERPDILSHSIVEDRADLQNVFTAIKFFSLPVQSYMLSKGYAETAAFIQLIRNWLRACNERGIKPNERVEYWYDTHEFLTRGVDFQKFPSKLCSCYVKGMLIQTFETLLQICSTRIYLYVVAVDKTCNSRGISTLQSESYFSDVKRMDKEGHGYPKGPTIHKLIGKCATVNAYKHKATKYEHVHFSSKFTSIYLYFSIIFSKKKYKIYFLQELSLEAKY